MHVQLRWARGCGQSVLKLGQPRSKARSKATKQIRIVVKGFEAIWEERFFSTALQRWPAPSFLSVVLRGTQGERCVVAGAGGAGGEEDGDAVALLEPHGGESESGIGVQPLGGHQLLVALENIDVDAAAV